MSKIDIIGAAFALLRSFGPTLGILRAFGTSALANGASLAAGLLLRAAGVPV